MKLFFTSRRIYVACFMMLALPVYAESDQDQAREAVRAGEVMPLEQVLPRVQKIIPGRVLKVELERKRGIWVYEIKLLRDNGTLSKLYFDARDGTLLENEPHHGRYGRRWGHRGPGGWENREND